MGYGAVLFQGGSVWSPGDTVAFDAAGGPVPAFSTEIVGPDQVVAPAVPSGLGRDADLALSWSGGDVGAFVYQIAFADSFRKGALTCSFPVAQGGGIVPARLLAQVTPGPAVVWQTVRNGKSLQVGETKVMISLYSDAVVAGGTALASGDVVVK